MKRITFILARLVTLCTLVHFITSCTTQSPHSGIFPFCTMEKPSSRKSVSRRAHDGSQTPQRMTEVVRYHYDVSSNEKKFQQAISQIKTGDVIAFYMSHQQARNHLKRGRIQKIPYELCRYGHLSVVVPDPNIALHQQTQRDAKLLQVAMKQAITASDDLDHLRDQSWIVHRPPVGSIDSSRLHSFAEIVTVKGSSSDKAYDYAAALGFWNGQFNPVTPEQINDQYTCCTLIVAALHYSGYQLHCARRNGIFDVITPRQVIDSWGTISPARPDRSRRQSQQLPKSTKQATSHCSLGPAFHSRFLHG